MEQSKRKPRRLMNQRERLECRVNNARRKLNRYTKRGKKGLAHRYQTELAKLTKKLEQMAVTS
jgi:hypothetical protein